MKWARSIFLNQQSLSFLIRQIKSLWWQMQKPHYLFAWKIVFLIMKVCVCVRLCVCMYEWQRVLIPFVEKTILPPLNYFCIFAKNKSYLCRSISRVSILFHWSICLFLHQISHSLDYCYSIGSLQIWLWDFSNFILIFQNCFSYSSAITFAYKL